MNKILVIDDDPHMLKLIEFYLSKEKYKIETTKSSRLGLSMLKKAKYDLVLADMLMPEMDGYTLLEKINADSKINALVIIITAHNLVDDLMRAVELGAYDILQKPFTANRLRLTIKNALNYQILIDKYAKLKRTVKKGSTQK